MADFSAGFKQRDRLHVRRMREHIYDARRSQLEAVLAHEATGVSGEGPGVTRDVDHFAGAARRDGSIITLQSVVRVLSW